MNIIAMDIASEVSSICILGSGGRLFREFKVPTRISHLREIIKKVPRPRRLVFEEGTQAAWLWSELHGLCDDVLVCDPRANAELSGAFKNDRNDARQLALRARGNLLKRVWHGGHAFQSMRETVRTYQCLTEECVRLKNQIRAVFRGNGMCIGARADSLAGRKQWVRHLRLPAQRERVLRLGAILDDVVIQRNQALKTMVRYARRNKMYRALRRIDGIGPVFASMFIAEVGDPQRFRQRQQFWSYAGLAVSTDNSGEFELRDGRVVRKVRGVRTRGLIKAYNRTLKYLLKQAAMTLSRTKWAPQYKLLLVHSKNKNNALLTLARKLAAVMLHIAKTGEKYEITKVFKAQ